MAPSAGLVGSTGGNGGYCTGGRAIVRSGVHGVYSRSSPGSFPEADGAAVIGCSSCPGCSAGGDSWGGQVPESGGACSGSPFRARMIWAGYGVNREAAMAARQMQTASLNQVRRGILRRCAFMMLKKENHWMPAGLSGGACP